MILYADRSDAMGWTMNHKGSTDMATKHDNQFEYDVIDD